MAAPPAAAYCSTAAAPAARNACACAQHKALGRAGLEAAQQLLAMCFTESGFEPAGAYKPDWEFAALALSHMSSADSRRSLLFRAQESLLQVGAPLEPPCSQV
jgi:hypothetical protein